MSNVFEEVIVFVLHVFKAIKLGPSRVLLAYIYFECYVSVQL